MSKVHYFQRYSQRENVATNNTLQLISKLYAHKPAYLEAFVNALVQTEVSSVEVGPVFSQQARIKDGSVPDAVIEQQSFKVVVEAKHHTNPTVEQLAEHLRAFGDESVGILVLLTPVVQSEDFQQDLSAKVREFNVSEKQNVVHICTTFHEVISIIRDLIAEYDYELLELLDDYEEYCALEGLLPREEFRMRAVPCGKTLKENFDLDIYYRDLSKGSTPHTYIGLYDSKCIRGVGKISNIVDAHLDGEELKVTKCDRDPTEDEKRRIRDAMDRALEERGWNLANGRKFFLVEEFHETQYRKLTPHGMPGPRFFDLGEVLEVGSLPLASEIADLLKERIW